MLRPLLAGGVTLCTRRLGEGDLEKLVSLRPLLGGVTDGDARLG